MNVRNKITSLQAQQQDTTKQLDQAHSELQKAKAQQASLEAMQQTALGQRNNPVLPWLAQHQLDKQPRLAQHIEVAAGWEHAAEKVLGSHLQAVCVDKIAEVADKVSLLKEGTLCAFAASQQAAQPRKHATTLLSKIKSALPLESLLGGIYVADTMEEALALCSSLDAHESVITAEGGVAQPVLVACVP